MRGNAHKVNLLDDELDHFADLVLDVRYVRKKEVYVTRVDVM